MRYRAVHPYFPAVHLPRQLDRWMQSFLQDSVAPVEHHYPAVNVWEADDQFHLEAELPGFKLDEVEVYVVGDTLTLKGKRPATDRENATLQRRERGIGEFERTLKLPVELDAEKVQAVLKNGVLQLTLPKVAAVRPKKISVTSA